MATRTEEGRQFTIEAGEDGILHLRFRPGARLVLEDIHELTERAQAMRDGHKPLLIAHLENLASADHEARKAGASVALFSAVAIVSNSPVGRTIGNFYLAVSSPATPTKMFANEKQARAWLEEQT